MPRSPLLLRLGITVIVTPESTGVVVEAEVVVVLVYVRVRGSDRAR